MAGDNLAVRVKALRWFHSIDLGNGVVTPGDKSIGTIQTEQRIFFDPIALKGATLLDIGAWNGAYSFEATRRGANVLATDHYVWTHDVWRGREGFDIANEVLGLSVKTKVIDVPDISVGSVGRHDVVLFLGVLYHLPSPLTLLQSVAEVASECLVVETHADLLDIKRPALAYYPGTTLNGDPTNFFGPNLAFIVEALKECGYSIFDSHYQSRRLTVHAWRSTRLRKLGTASESHVYIDSRPSFSDRVKMKIRSLIHPTKSRDLPA
jgi:tRNA (mo5U34)-methyltransferase